MQAAGCEVLTSLESMSWDLWKQDLDLMEKFLDGREFWKLGPLLFKVVVVVWKKFMQIWLPLQNHRFLAFPVCCSTLFQPHPIYWSPVTPSCWWTWKRGLWFLHSGNLTRWSISACWSSGDHSLKAMSTLIYINVCWSIEEIGLLKLANQFQWQSVSMTTRVRADQKT